MKFASKLNRNLSQAIFLPVNEGPAGISAAPCRGENLLKTRLQLSFLLLDSRHPESFLLKVLSTGHRFICQYYSGPSLACLVSQASVRNLLCWIHLCLGVLGLSTKPFEKSKQRKEPSWGWRPRCQLEMELPRLLAHLQGRWQSHLLQTY